MFETYQFTLRRQNTSKYHPTKEKRCSDLQKKKVQVSPTSRNPTKKVKMATSEVQR
jgi:hypothetical protein